VDEKEEGVKETEDNRGKRTRLSGSKRDRRSNTGVGYSRGKTVA